jgi:hypothetical protein
MPMADLDFKRLNRLMMIYRIVQTMLVALLFYMALNFQHHFSLKGRPDQFIKSILIAIVFQLIAVFPVYKLAWRDAGIEFDGSVTGLSGEHLAALRKKRLIGDLWKFCAVAFFIVFVFMAPSADKAAGAPLVLVSILFSFLLTCLMYFQCFNFSAKKRMKST